MELAIMDEAWEQWQRMAVESQMAAHLLAGAGHLRPSASRYYYAAYQAATALLLYGKVIPPEQREAWSHEATPQLLKSQLSRVVRSRDVRNSMGERLSALYHPRVTCVYQAGQKIDRDDLERARKDAGYVMKVAGDALKEGRM
jgi:uncharacterized protein (UPF0332 family)